MDMIKVELKEGTKTFSVNKNGDIEVIGVLPHYSTIINFKNIIAEYNKIMGGRKWQSMKNLRN